MGSPYNINFKPDKFQALLILCGHDTHHDFFGNNEPFKSEYIDQRGGAITKSRATNTQSRYWTRARGRAEASVRAKQTTRQTNPTRQRIINKGNKGNKGRTTARISQNQKEAITDYWERRMVFMEMELEDLTMYIEEDDNMYTYLSDDKTTHLMGDDYDISMGLNTSGGAPSQARRSSRSRAPPEDVADKINEKKRLLRIIFDKVRVWDTYVYLIENPLLSGYSEENERFGKLNGINSRVPTDRDRLSGFYGWLKSNEGDIKSNDLLEIIRSSEHDVPSFAWARPHHAAVNSFKIHILIKHILDNDATPTTQIELDNIFKDLKKFVAYTSINNINDVTEPFNVSINIDMFVKKRWSKYQGDPTVDSGSDLEELLKLDKDCITLTAQEISDIGIMKNYVMKYWVDFSGILPTLLNKPNWLQKQVNKMYIFDPRRITDIQIRDDFLLDEYNISKNGRQGIYQYTPDPRMVPGVRSVGVEEEILNVSNYAFEDKSFGNNASGTKYYARGDGGEWKHLNKKKAGFLEGPLMDDKQNYNCNLPNVADPATTCPRCGGDSDCRSYNSTTQIILDASIPGGSVQKITLDMDKGSKSYLTVGSKIHYEIEHNGKTLEMTDEINTKKRGKKVEGLSKKSVLGKVFQKMRELTDGGTHSSSETLNLFLGVVSPGTEPLEIKEIVQVFCLKLFGDFGQELLAVGKSQSGPSVYIGNDWISYIRFLFLKDNMVPPSQHPWWGGFLGNTSFNIIYHIPGYGVGGGKKKMIKRISKKTKRKKSKLKSRKKTKKKKSKRKSRKKR